MKNKLKSRLGEKIGKKITALKQFYSRWNGFMRCELGLCVVRWRICVVREIYA